MSTQQTSTIPAGYMQDPQGRLIPEAMVEDIDKLRDQTVREIVAELKELQALTQAKKRKTFDAVQAFCEISAEKYEITWGGNKGNVSLRSFDGQYKVERAIQDCIVFDERLQVAKNLISECIDEWIAEGVRPELAAIAQDAFQVDKEGRVSVAKVLSLRRFNFPDPRWQRAMHVIAECIMVTGSRSYIRVYERVGATNKYVPIVLDWSAI
ncbi:DUF3164 family protein [Vitreoscilla filiformis]|nr:DUF3164 family protein [Vitreoscilla filiformis]